MVVRHHAGVHPHGHPGLPKDGQLSGWRVRPLAPGEGERIAGWRYEPPYDTYDVPRGEESPSAAQGYRAIVDESEDLVGFLVTGAEGRVAGQHPEDGVIDIGVGMRPDLMGRGHSRALVAAIGAYLAAAPAPRYRIAVLDWNARSLKVARRAGFSDTGSIRNEQGTFTILERSN